MNDTINPDIERRKPATFRWLGVAGFELNFKGRTLLCDPFLTRPVLWQVLFSKPHSNGSLLRQYIPSAHTILVTHSHYDHLMDVPEVAGYTGADVYGSANTCRILEFHGIPGDRVHRVQPGDYLRLDPFQVEVLEGCHTPIPLFGAGTVCLGLRSPLHIHDYRLDVTFSFLIRMEGIGLLNWHNIHPAPAPSADILLLGPDVAFHDLPVLLEQVRPKLVIPIHWDNFLIPLSRPQRSFSPLLSMVSPLIGRMDMRRLSGELAKITPTASIHVPQVFERVTYAEAPE